EASRIRRFPGAVLGLALALVFAFTAVAAAPGTPGGAPTGGGRSPGGGPPPRGTLAPEAPAPPRGRAAGTPTTGSYIFRGLPPGAYAVSFALSGFSTVERKVEITLGNPTPLDATLTVATVQETVEVRAEAPSILDTTQVGANLKAETVDKLGQN